MSHKSVAKSRLCSTELRIYTSSHSHLHMGIIDELAGIIVYNCVFLCTRKILANILGFHFNIFAQASKNNKDMFNSSLESLSFLLKYSYIFNDRELEHFIFILGTLLCFYVRACIIYYLKLECLICAVW